MIVMSMAFKILLFVLIASTYINVIASLGGVSGRGLGFILNAFLSNLSPAFCLVIIFGLFFFAGLSLLFQQGKEFGRHRLPLFTAINLILAVNLYLFFMTAR
jgi:hypothetical protein